MAIRIADNVLAVPRPRMWGRSHSNELSSWKWDGYRGLRGISLLREKRTWQMAAGMSAFGT